MDYRLRVAGHKALMRGYSAATWVLPINQPKLLLGEGSIGRLCAMVPGYGVSHVLLVTDGDLAALGLPDGCREALEGAGLRVTTYDGVGPNPTEEQIEAGIELGRAQGCDAVLAFGGGSPMDAGKVIAAGLTNNKAVAKMEGAFKIRKAPVPIFAVPTTAGTGAEATVGAVVTSTADRRKYTVADHKLVPEAAALDPSVMLDLPPAVTAVTGIDALTHAIEAFVSTRVLGETERSAKITIRLVFEHLPTAFEQGHDVEAREAMSLAAYEGGVAICKAGVGYVHAIAHQLGGMYHVPHGLANSVLLPHVLDYSKDQCGGRLAELAVVAGLGQTGESEAVLADRLIEAVRDLNRRLQLPETLEEIDEADVPEIAVRAIDEAFQLWAVPKYMQQADAEAIVRRVMAA